MMPNTVQEALELTNGFKVKAPESMQKKGGPMRAVFAAAVIPKWKAKGKSDKKKGDKAGQPSKMDLQKKLLLVGNQKCDQEGHQPK